MRTSEISRKMPLIFLLRLMPLAAILLLSQTACSLPFGSNMITISGTVYGDSLALEEQGTTKAVPLNGATVTCDTASTKTDKQGHYSLSVNPQKSYDCQAYQSLYQTEDNVITPVSGHNLTLNFGPKDQVDCAAAKNNASEIDCQALGLQAGSIQGDVTYEHSNTLVANATVECVQVDSTALSSPLDNNQGYPAEKAANGKYDIAALPTGLYTCLASVNNIVRGRQIITVTPGGTTNISIKVCANHCPPVTYHDGPVMRMMTAYLIFWLPPQYHFEPLGSDQHFESLMARFFQDLQGTRYYGLLTQYWDYQGSVQNQVALGDTYVDKNPYQHCSYAGDSCSDASGTSNDPLYDSDIFAEVNRAIKANPGWSAAQTNEFFVFTGNGIEECPRRGADSCTFSPYPHGVCAYHSYFSASNTTPATIYAYIPDTASDQQECAPQSSSFGPNRDSIADQTLDFVSHELFESVSDPLYNSLGGPSSGWFDDAVDAKNRGEGEIGDLCASNYGAVGADGGNVTLNHGHRYIVQSEWSNLSNSCTFG